MGKLIKNGETYSGSFSDASQVKYGDSNVKEELDSLNDKLSSFQTGTITKHSSISTGTLSDTNCYKIGKVVSIGGRIHTMTNQVASGTFFVIPVGFRPKTATKIMAYMNVNNVGWVSMFATVRTDGQVELGYSASYQCTQIGIAGSYPVD